MTTPTPAFDPEPMLQVLSRHRVRFVVVGGFAASYHGSVHVTFDLDITPEMSEANLERLSDALHELDAQVRAGDESFAFNHDARSLGAATVWNLRTPHGDLDLTIMPAGTRGYEDLHRDSITDTVLGVSVEIASLADVVRSKAAADRPKDHLTLPTLRRLLEEQDG